MKQEEKLKALDAALVKIEKDYGKGSVMKLGEYQADRTIEVTPTGSISLDIALGVGGVPKGRIIEIYGPESSGKTTVALHMVAEVQKRGGIAGFIDAEHALDPVYAKNIGVDIDNLYISQPDTGEQGLEITETMVRSGAIDIIIVDSVAALVPKAEIDGDMGDSHISFQRSRRIKNKTSVKLKRSKEKRLASIRREPAEPEELYSEDSLEINELLQQRQEEKSQKHQKIFSNIMSGVLIAGCVYVSILIYGVMVTDYNYNENGEIVPEVVSVQDIKEEKAYDTILYQYLQCRSLYEEVLMLDYRLGKGEEDPLTLAPLYEEKLDTVSSLSIKTDALTVETKYSKVKDMLLSWIKNDIAVYLQNMSSAISQNNSETAQNALQDKDRVYSDFSLITQNLVAMGENLQGVDLTDVKQWTPEDYVDEQINGE